MIATLWDKIPFYIKYPLMLLAVASYAPIWVQEKFDARWDARAAPLIKQRDLQYAELTGAIKEVKLDTREIKFILMNKDK